MKKSDSLLISELADTRNALRRLLDSVECMLAVVEDPNHAVGSIGALAASKAMALVKGGVDEARRVVK